MSVPASAGAAPNDDADLRRRVYGRGDWDRSQIPWPFTRAVLLIAPPTAVRAGGRQELAADQANVQATLEGPRDRGDAWWRPRA